jgi:hypothetical protein
MAWLILRLARLRKLKEGASRPAPELQALFARMRFYMKREVSLMVSGRQRSPLVLGFIRPVVLLPMDLAGQSDLTEAEHVLVHELAHVRRYDDWANLVQHFIQAALFFHPAVWWINRKLSLEREIACDDHVLNEGSGTKNYALVLTNVARRISQSAPILAPGVLNSNSQLQQRISMILNTRRNSSPVLAKTRLASILSASAAIGAAALYLGPRVVIAETPSPAPTPSVQVRVDSHPVVRPVLAGLVVAEADETSASTPAVASGPKFKRDGWQEPGEVIPPEPPEAPDIEVESGQMRAPHVARMSKPGKAPRAPDSPDANNNGDDSIEGRVRRLEKMVKELVSEQKGKHVHTDFSFKNNYSDEFQQKDGDKLKALADEQASRNLKGLVDEQASRAVEQARRAAEQAKRASRDLQARTEQDHQGIEEFREAHQQQLEALRKARENLGQEMERLDRQIQKLEKDQQRSDKDKNKEQPRRSDVPAAKLQAQVAFTAQPAR